MRYGFVIWVTLLLAACNPFADSPYSNCIVVEDESHFTGKALNHSEAKSKGTKKTVECIALDKELDGGDGPTKGKVRWLVCGLGPDCHDLGLY